MLTLKKLGLLLAIAVFASVATAGKARKGSVVVLPTAVFRGASENGVAVTTALKHALEEQGYEVRADARIDKAIEEQGLNRAQIHPLTKIADLRTALGVDFVLYPRILTVGQGAQVNDSQINILLNIAGASRSSYAYTRQVGQEFRPEVQSEKPVIDAANAGKAADRLLEEFKGLAK